MTVQAELLSDEEKRKIEELVEQEEGGIHRFVGWWGRFLTFIAFTMTIFHLYAAASTVDTQSLREIHVAYALSLVFLLFPAVKSWRNRVAPWDIAAAGLVIVVIWYMMTGGSWTSFADSDDFLDRYVSPTQTDLVIGGILILLVLESTRRATGWIMPILSVHLGNALRVVGLDLDLDEPGIGFAEIGLRPLGALHRQRRARDRADMDGTAALEGELDLAARLDVAQVQLVDVGEDADLVEVDDLRDAAPGDALALPRVDIHHHAVERGADQRKLALDLRILELGFENGDA
ncbi:hypothetical protein OSTOST_11352 [Ostertagia ostertagi]